MGFISEYLESKLIAEGHTIPYLVIENLFSTGQPPQKSKTKTIFPISEKNLKLMTNFQQKKCVCNFIQL